MKAYLIDPFAKTVTEIEIADHTDMKKHMDDMYAALQCKLFEIGSYLSEDNYDCVLVDEEGLLGDMEQQQFFNIKIYDEHVMPLAGRGLVIGTDTEGNSISPTMSLEKVKSLVTFVTPEQVLSTID